ncbi:POL3 protein, partial [Pseudoatta argentina]
MLNILVKAVDVNRMFKQVIIENKSLYALLDTGSHLSLMSEDVFKTFKTLKLHESEVLVTGIAQGRVKTLGYFQSTVPIDNVDFPLAFHVVPSEALNVDVILGTDLIIQAEVRIDKDGIAISKPNVSIFLSQIELQPEKGEAIYLKYGFFHSQAISLDINKSKCQLLQSRVEYLGYIENNTIHPSPGKIQAVSNFPEPRTLKDVQSFLGLLGYFRKFIESYAIKAKPLSDLLRKENSFRFDVKEKESFKQLKSDLSNSPVLRIFNLDNKLHPVYYMSCKTTETESRYTSYELEVLAVIRALDKFRHYLLGIRFKIVTDCIAFKQTLSKVKLSAKIARWALVVEEFDVIVEHRASPRMKHVDALSRYPVMEISSEDNIILKVVKAQKSDPELRAILEVLKEKPYDDYTMCNDVLYKFKDGRKLLVIPQDMQSEIFLMAHGRGHFSVKAGIITDRGTAFSSLEFQNYCKEEGIKHCMVTTGLPRANGQVERLNRTIIPVLTKLAMNPTKWYKYVPIVQQTVISTFHRSISMTPFELLTGDRDQLRKQAKEQIRKIQNENRKTYNLKRREPTKYKINDLVAITRVQVEPGKKLCAEYLGPYKVVLVKSNNSYDVE